MNKFEPAWTNEEDRLARELADIRAAAADSAAPAADRLRVAATRLFEPPPPPGESLLKYTRAAIKMKRLSEDERQLLPALRLAEELRTTLESLHAALTALPPADPDDVAADRDRVAAALADTHGIIGGLHRRHGDLAAARDSYRAGTAIEQDARYHVVNSYNQTNHLIHELLLNPLFVRDGRGAFDRLAREIDLQIRRRGRKDDPWAYVDLAVVYLLLGRVEEAEAMYKQAGDRIADWGRKSHAQLLRNCEAALLRGASEWPEATTVANAVRTKADELS